MARISSGSQRFLKLTSPSVPELRLVRTPEDSPVPKPSAELRPSGIKRRFEFNAWYREYGSLVARLVHRRVRDYQKAEDVISDVWRKILHSGARYDSDRGRETTFIMRIASRTIIDYFRRAKHADRVNGSLLGDSDDALDRQAVRSGPTALNSQLAGAEALVREERRNRLLRLLDCVEPYKRSVVERCCFQGIPLRQIALEDGRPEGTVKSAYSRALAELRNLAASLK